MTAIPVRSRALSGFVLLALLAAGLAPGDAVGQRKTARLSPPPRSDAGKWHGTWVYAARDHHFAIYLRTVDGRTELKVQFENTSAPETFATDWNGKASYHVSGRPGEFEMVIAERDEDTISGTWYWERWRSRSVRIEEAGFELYRAADGRQMVLLFKDLVQTRRTGDDVRRSLVPQVWTFFKVSKRVVRWEELPF